MDEKNKDIVMKNIDAGGDVAAFIDKSVHNNLYPKSYMQILIDKFKKEKENDIIFKEKVEEFERYCSSAEKNDNIIGLEKKLNDGGYFEYVDYALKNKERFYKKIAKYELYESAQHIFANILAYIYTNFHNHIFPLINKGEDKSKIQAAIQEKIIDPVYSLLGENVLELIHDEINGAIYFLTGNCHIKWTV